MRISLLISTLGHILAIFLIIFGGSMVDFRLPEEEKISPDYNLISLQEFDAMLSEAPTNVTKLVAAQIRNQPSPVREAESFSEDISPDIRSFKSDLATELNDKAYQNKNENPRPDINTDQNIKIPGSTEKQKINKILVKKIEGNERLAFSKPNISIPKPRMADRIEKVASEKSISKKVVDKKIEAVKVSNEANEVKKITNAEAPKEASSQISPEGKKDVEIVTSGAVLKSSSPLSRPDIAEINQKKQPNSSEKFEKPIKRPNANDLLKQSRNNQYDELIAQVEANLQTEVPEVSAVEERNMIQAITQKLAKYWEQGILAGNSNFEKYVVKVEVKVNEVGEIEVERIKPIAPVNPKGRYAIAYRQASNALISAKTLPIIPGKYPNGITLEVNFDPETGFSF